MKKMISFVLIVILTFSAYSTVIFNASAEEADDFYYYILPDGTALIESYDGFKTDIVIPSELDGHTVKRIGKAFNSSNIKSVLIPDSVEIIDEDAFLECNYLESVTFGNNIKTIGESAFGGCDSLTSVVITAETIGDFAFANCDRLEMVIFGDNVKTIGNRSFRQCKSLNSVVFSDSVETIGNYAFVDCKHLESVTFGNSIKTIGESAFSSNNLKSVVIPDSVETIGSSAFIGCNLTTVTIGNNVKTIGYGAFSYNVNLKNITIPDSVEIISGAFSNCHALEEVTIGNNVKTIGADAFSCNCNLKNIVIPDSVETIGSSAFQSCANLETVTIGNNVKTIGASAFDNCDSLKSVIIPDSVESIDYWAFIGCNLTTVTIGNNVKTMGNRVFAYNFNLKNINIPDSVESIGTEAFLSCDLETVTMGKGVSNIGKDAFKYNDSMKNIFINDENDYFYDIDGVPYNKQTNDIIIYPRQNESKILTIHEGVDTFVEIKNNYLEDIYIPSTVTKINTISGNNLKNIFVSNDNPEYCDINGVLYNKDLTSLILYPPSNTTQVLDIPETVTNISCNFDNCQNLVTINIPANTTKFEPSFNNSPNLESINVDENNTRWKSIEGVLFSKDGTVLTRYPEGKKDKDYRLPDGLTSILRDGIRNLKYLENLTIPSDFTRRSWVNLGYNNMESLQNIYVEEGNPNYCDVEGVLFSKDKTTLIKYPTGRKDTTYEIPCNVTTLDDLSFYGSNNLTNITIPSNIKNISERPFLNCDNLKDITIAEEVSSICNFAFGYHLDGYPEPYDDEEYVRLEDVTIKGYTNTYAEAYAKKYGFNFVSIGVGENILGDANNDNDVNIQDATLVQMCVAKYPEKINTTNADIDKDGEITIRDATSVQMYVAKLIDTLYDVS